MNVVKLIEIPFFKKEKRLKINAISPLYFRLVDRLQSTTQSSTTACQADKEASSNLHIKQTKKAQILWDQKPT
jgi:hypothetical protein